MSHDKNTDNIHEEDNRTMTSTLTKTATLGKMDYVPYDSNYRFEVTFDFADASYTVQERHQSENGTSFYNAYGHAASYDLPQNTDASAFASWVAGEVRPILLRIKRGYKTRWNGNEIAVFTDSAKAAKDTLDALMDACEVPTLDEGQGQWDAGDWLSSAPQQTLTDYGVTAASDEDDLNAAAEEIDENALGMNVRLSGTRKWLEYAHYELVLAAEDNAAKSTKEN